MEINIKEKTEGFLVELSGRLDSSTSGALETKLTGLVNKKKNVVLDFKRVEYVSSAALRALLTIQKSLKASNNALSAINANEVVKEVFDITGFSSIIEIK